MGLEYMDEINTWDTKHSEGALWKVCTRTRCATYMGWITEHMVSNEKRIGKGIYEKGHFIHTLRSRKYLVSSYPPFLFLVERLFFVVLLLKQQSYELTMDYYLASRSTIEFSAGDLHTLNPFVSQFSSKGALFSQRFDSLRHAEPIKEGLFAGSTCSFPSR